MAQPPPQRPTRGPHARAEVNDAEVNDVALADKLAALRDPARYAPRPRRIESIETHMAWVVLAGDRALKLKKPTFRRAVDFATARARRRDCEREVALNRPLAGRVYRGITPIVLRAGGELAIGGSGRPVDWLVDMQRLPARESIAAHIAARSLRRRDVERAISWLTRFYETVDPEFVTETDYRARLARHIRHAKTELLRDRFGLRPEAIVPPAERQLEILDGDPELFAPRARAGALIDAHGDLRPEHVFVRPVPTFIDCLEFSRELRLLDPVSELAFFALECQRLGAPWVGEVALAVYAGQSGDHPPRRLVDFYRASHALTRAAVAIWHLEDPGGTDGARFRARAMRYLAMAERYSRRARRHPSVSGESVRPR